MNNFMQLSLKLIMTAKIEFVNKIGCG